jgi:hypothetical protein
VKVGAPSKARDMRRDEAAALPDVTLELVRTAGVLDMHH